MGLHAIAVKQDAGHGRLQIVQVPQRRRDETPGQIDPHACAGDARQRVLVFVLETPLHQQKRAVAERHGRLIDTAATPHPERPRRAERE